MKDYRTSLDRLLAEHSHALRQIKEEKEHLRKAEARVKALQEAQAILQAIAKTVQASAHSQISDIVSRCLEAVFGEEAYEFQIKFQEKRGKTEAELLFVQGDREIDPLGAAGGGVVDVASFALRLAALLLSRPAKRKLLVLDEPMKHLSRNYQPAVAQLLESLAREFGIQILLITHSDLLKVGKVIHLGEEND